MDHTTRALLGRTDVDTTSNQSTQFRPLLDRLDLATTVVTADAMHTQREHADWLVTHKHAAYLRSYRAPTCATRHRRPAAARHRNLAAALRRNARDATRVLPLPGITRTRIRQARTCRDPWPRRRTPTACWSGGWDRCGWFTSSCATSPTRATEQVKGAAEGWVVGRREATRCAVSGNYLARTPA
jgi:predicted transposase YbfD/YdcC